MPDDGARSRQIAEKIASQRGGEEVPEWTWLAQVDVEFADALTYVTTAAFSYGDYAETHSDPMSSKDKELVGVALLAAQRDSDRLRIHIERALDRGATEAEILDVLRVAMAVAGTPALRLGIEMLLSVLSEREDRAGAS